MGKTDDSGKRPRKESETLVTLPIGNNWLTKWRRVSIRAMLWISSTFYMAHGSQLLKDMAQMRESIGIVTRPGESGIEEMKKASQRAQQEARQTQEELRAKQAEIKKNMAEIKEQMAEAKKKAKEEKAKAKYGLSGSSSASSSSQT